MTPLRLSRRQFLKISGISGGTVVLSVLIGIPALEASGPCPHIQGKRIHWIVPYSPGGGFDVYSRLIAPFFEKRIGAEISVENVAGGGGIIGAYKIATADHNGLTLGIVNGPGLLIASLTGETEAPNPARDFTILGRIVRSRLVWATGKNSPFKTMEDVLEESKKRPIVFGITEIGSTNSVNVAVASHLLNIRPEYVAGYPGSRESSLAVLRGDVDIVSITFESALDRIESGDLRPLLQTSVERISPHPSLDGVALLGGKHGLAARQAGKIGHDVDEAIADAAALIGLVDAGRLIVVPLGFEENLLRCLEKSLYDVVTDPAFVKAATAAKRSLDVARGAQAHADVLAAVEKAKKLAPIVRDAIAKVRK